MVYSMSLVLHGTISIKEPTEVFMFRPLQECFALYQVHIHYFLLDCHVIAVYSNCLTQ